MQTNFNDNQNNKVDNKVVNVSIIGHCNYGLQSIYIEKNKI